MCSMKAKLLTCLFMMIFSSLCIGDGVDLQLTPSQVLAQKEMDRLEALISKQQDEYQKPKLNPQAEKESRETYKKYLLNWMKQVEEYGNTKRQLILNNNISSEKVVARITVAPNGSLTKLEITQKSENVFFNKWVEETILSSAPYAPLPNSMTRKADELLIERTFEISEENGFLIKPGMDWLVKYNRVRK
jgi:periplasmic protein TonB